MKPQAHNARLLPMVLRLAAPVLTVSLLLAQEPETPTFSTSTQLVQVDVVVKSKDIPVIGLTKDDFEILDNGKPQPIAVFSFRDVKNVTSTAKPLPPGVVSNRPISRGPEPVAATIILLDSINTFEEDEVRAQQQVLKYLDSATRSEWIAVHHLNIHLDVLQDFTLDRDKLRAAVQKWRRPQQTIVRPDLATQAGLRILAQHMSGLPGRKKLIWITSASIPFLQLFTAGNPRDVKEFEPLARFIDSNVAVYPINPRGLQVRGLGLRNPNITFMRNFAEATGGKSFMMDNDLAAGIEEAFTDTDITYTLGFYVSNSASIQPHSIRVNVKRSGVEARYRNEYTIEKSRTLLSDIDRTGVINGWVHMPLNLTDIPIQAHADAVSGKPGYFDVSILLDVSAVRLEPVANHLEGSIEVAVVPDKDIDDKPKGLRQRIKLAYNDQTLPKAIENGAKIVNQVRLTKSNGKLIAKRLRVVVMDNSTGKAGSVWIPLQ